MISVKDDCSTLKSLCFCVVVVAFDMQYILMGIVPSLIGSVYVYMYAVDSPKRQEWKQWKPDLRRISCHGRNYSQPYFFKRSQSSDNRSHGFGAKFLLK